MNRCDVCDGKGKVVKSTCPICKGHKVKRGSTQMTVTLEKGMKEGQELRFEREADQSPDHTPGDVVFELRVAPHPVFERKGDHLYVTETLNLKEALLGFNHTLKHLDGESVTLSRNEPTQPGFVQEIPSQGMPRHEFPSERGSLYVTYQVYLPSKLSLEQSELVKNQF
jgi:DnaJ-related protein SCJ1